MSRGFMNVQKYDRADRWPEKEMPSFGMSFPFLNIEPLGGERIVQKPRARHKLNRPHATENKLTAVKLLCERSPKWPIERSGPVGDKHKKHHEMETSQIDPFASPKDATTTERNEIKMFLLLSIKIFSREILLSITFCCSFSLAAAVCLPITRGRLSKAFFVCCSRAKFI